MTARIAENRLIQAAKSRENLPATEIYRRIANAVLVIRPNADRYNTKTWVELRVSRGIRLHTHLRWADVFLEEPQDIAEAIIDALCAA
jgi:hypothetical protein